MSILLPDGFPLIFLLNNKKAIHLIEFNCCFFIFGLLIG